MILPFLSIVSGPEPSPPTGGSTDFIIGDRVWVGGTKPGHITYIGETQFAPGEWAGVVLNEPVGKNDGSVAGVRYFQCEPKKGVFSRLAKLTRQRIEGGVPSAPPETPVKGKTVNDVGTPASAMPSKLGAGSKTGGLPRKSSLTGSASNLTRASPSGSTHNLTSHSCVDTSKFPFKVGDRVLVSGSKAGVLRYIGSTDFAKGDWAGVELDEPLGKNDGAVAGKR